MFRRLLDGELDVALQRIGRLGQGEPVVRAVLLFLGPTGAVEREVDVSSVDIPRSPGTSRGVNQ